MGVSNFGAFAAVSLTIINECIKAHTPDYHFHSIILAIIVSLMWCIYNHVSDNMIGLLSAAFFVGLNMFYLDRHLQDSKESIK
jgi:hypothetical protein